jgi:hypothetical protein
MEIPGAFSCGFQRRGATYPQSFHRMSANPPTHCLWCGFVATPEAQKKSGGGSRCEHCQRMIGPLFPGQTSQACGACHEVFLAGAHYCPACGTVAAASPPSPLQAEHGLLPSPRQPIWPTKSWWQEDGQGLIAPPCPACGEKLRPDGAGSHEHIGQALPPWNAGWDGRCAACGREVGVTIEQQTHFHSKRIVRLRPAESFHRTFIDEGMVFSGVRVRVEETAFGDESPRVSEVFLSMGELMNLVRSLDETAKPLLSQFDWTCDWT